MTTLLIAIAMINLIIAMWNASLGNHKTTAFNVTAAAFCIFTLINNGVGS